MVVDLGYRETLKEGHRIGRNDVMTTTAQLVAPRGQIELLRKGNFTTIVLLLESRRDMGHTMIPHP